MHLSVHSEGNGPFAMALEPPRIRQVFSWQLDTQAYKPKGETKTPKRSVRRSHRANQIA